MRALPNSRRNPFARLTLFALPFFAVFALCLTSLPQTTVKAQSDANAEAKESAVQVPQAYRAPYDFTGDNRSDFANLINTGVAGTPLTWNILRNPAQAGPGNAFIRRFEFGVSGDVMTAGDYIGTSKVEASVFRPTAGTFFHLPFPESGAPSTFTPVLFGTTDTFDNTGRVGDYDGDGKDDEVTVRIISQSLIWAFKGSAGQNRTTQFGRTVTGQLTFVFQGADFTGDGRDEFVYCTVTQATGANTWWIGDSFTGAVIKGGFRWGNWVTDYFVSPDDYTGDGIADIPVVRMGAAAASGGGSWYILNGATNAVVPPVVFGTPDPNFTDEDIPVRGDFDGDNRSDVAVYRRSTATYFWLKSSDGIIGAQQHGTPADANELPLGTFFVF